jgi:hypothetical protein
VSDAKKKGPAPYGFDPAFERVVAAMLCCRPKFYGLVGHELEPARMEVPSARLAVMAAQEIGAESGRGPSDPVLVLQRLRRWVADGKVTSDEVDAVLDLIEESGHNPPPELDVVMEAKPVIQRLLHEEAVRATMEAYSKRGDMGKAKELIRRAETVGVQDRSVGSKLGVGVLSDIARLRASDRLATGILELDMGLGGGLPRGKLGLMMAGPKAGKSMYLIHQASFAIQSGLFTAMATLELEEEDQQARLIANLTGIPIQSIMDGQADREVAEKLEKLESHLGVFRVKRFPAIATTVQDIAEWVKEIEDQEGRKVDLLEVDYVDKMGISDRRIVSTYDIQGRSTEELRLYVSGRSIWGWTASQPKRRDKKDKDKRIDIDDAADSQNKVRVVDLILTMHRPTEQEVEFYVAGNRNGKGQFSVGPLPHNLECAQLVPVG